MALVALECKFVTGELVRELKSANAPPPKFMQPVPAARFAYELCWTVVRGELPAAKCQALLEASGLLEDPVKEETASILADNVAHMGLELTVPGGHRARLVELAKFFVEAGLVPIRFFQERCETEFLHEAEMIKIKAPELKAKEVRVNTRLLYQQTKFNLLREESEGYAKLLTILSQTSDNRSSAVVSTIKSLIGHFDLDPNRVFDLVLDYFELHPENTIFLSLIPLFPKSHMCHILGFKFQYYQRVEVERSTPPGLFRLAATLVKGDFVDLDAIYAHLLPKNEEAVEQYEEVLKRRLEDANKIGKINLAATGKDLMDEEKPGDVTIDLYAALDSEAEAAGARALEIVTNQKLGLLHGFLVVDDWPHAHITFERLGALNPIGHEEICKEVLRLLGNAIASCYDRLKPSYLSKAGTARAPATDMKRECFQMLSWLGPYLYRDVLLLQKVCKVLRAYYVSAISAVSATRSSESEHRDAKLALKEVRLKVEEALGVCLLPSLQLLPANPAICIAIWEVMSCLPYEVRYRMYGEWEKDDEQIPVLLSARQIAKLDTRRILKRLAKENLKQLGRMIAKIAHANPLTVIRTIVNQIEAYKDMITPVVDAFKYLTQLEYDVLEYVVLERLSQAGRDKLKEDGLNLSDWLQSLASFWGHLCKKYPSMELRGLFQYLVNQLKRGEGIELVVLQELMQQMANVEHIENVTEDQLEALSGSETLKHQATAFGLTRNNKALMKSTNRLRDALLPKDDLQLAVPLLILIAQYRSNVINKADGPHVKVVSEQYDRSHGALLQYTEFLNVAVTPTLAYAQLVPSLEDLVHVYHLEPETAFLIFRPVIRLFKPEAETENTSGVGDATAPNSSQLVLDLGPNRPTITRSDLLKVVHSMLPQKAWMSISPEFYLTFWELSLRDLYVPRKRYELEIGKQRSALKSLEENTDNSYSGITKRKKDKEKIQETLDRLSSELQAQEQEVSAVHERLLREKDSWLTSCPDSSRINMEFLQRCIFPRCVFSMVDAVYCAKFVKALHSLGTPFFNTVNHIDSLICKTLQPLVSCCTEYEAGRLGRFLLETLKMAYHWKSDESVYDRECGSMPGFGLYYRDPKSPKVTYKQYIQVHWKWNSRLTRLMIQCLESSDYMEIRNALTVLTKLSSLFPVTKKTGVNIEKRVNKIKQDDREDLKVLATGVAAALASRKSAWVSDESFVMGHTEILKALVPTPAVKPAVDTAAPISEGTKPVVAQTTTTATVDAKHQSKGRRIEPPSVNSGDGRSSVREDARSSSRDKDFPSSAKASADDEGRLRKSNAPVTPGGRSTKVDFREEPNPSRAKADLSPSITKDAPESRPRAGTAPNSIRGSHSLSRTSNSQDVPKPRETNVRASDPKASDRAEAYELGTGHLPSSGRSPSHRDDALSDKEKLKRSAVEDSERFSKRRKAEINSEAGEIRNADRWSAERPRSADYEKVAHDERISSRERSDREYGRGDRSIERMERGDRGDDYGPDKSSRDRLGRDRDRDRSVDRGSDRNLERNADRSVERNADRNIEYFERTGRDERLKEERRLNRHGDIEHPDDRFGPGLPPPPPVPLHLVPHSISRSGSRRDEEERRSVGTMQRMSPHRDDKRRPEEATPDDSKRRRDEDVGRDRKARDERDMQLLKAEKERERAKEEADAALSKRRKLKRDQFTSAPEGHLPPAPLPPPPQPIQLYDRERKSVPQARSLYSSSGMEMHSKEPAKLPREPMYEREWEEEKRRAERAEMKRRHHSRK